MNSPSPSPAIPDKDCCPDQIAKLKFWSLKSDFRVLKKAANRVKDSSLWLTRELLRTVVRSLPWVGAASGILYIPNGWTHQRTRIPDSALSPLIKKLDKQTADYDPAFEAFFQHYLLVVGDPAAEEAFLESLPAF